MIGHELDEALHVVRIAMRQRTKAERNKHTAKLARASECVRDACARYNALVAAADDTTRSLHRARVTARQLTT